MPRQLSRQHIEVATDDRGSLLPIEFGDVPFAVRRVFVVTGVPGGSQRGDHEAGSSQMLLLTSGHATVRIGDDRNTLGEATALDQPGDYVLVQPGDYISYTLADERSSVLVLAEKPYTPRNPA